MIKRLIAGIVLTFFLMTDAAMAASQCQKELPIAQVKGKWPWAPQIYETPTEMLRAACPVDQPLIEDSVKMWTVPTTAEPYPQWIGICYRPPRDPSVTPGCQPGYGYSCSAADGSQNNTQTIRIDTPFCNGKEVGRLLCGDGDGYYRCVGNDKNINSCGDGNPIGCTTANKHQDETDIASADSLLKFVRSYNSTPAIGYTGNFSSGMGRNWRHNFSRAVVALGDQHPAEYVAVVRPNGQSFQFVKNTSSGLWETTTDVSHRLIDKFDASNNLVGFEFSDSESQETETYDAGGRLISIRAITGHAITLTYDSNGLSSVEDEFGHSLGFQFTAGLLAQLTDMNGQTCRYQYDANGNLAAVVYPDNTQRTYLYNEAAHTSATNLPHALTGITDESGQRFATFEYDSQGRAVSTEHAGGTYKYTLSYPTNQAIVTDPLGKVTTRNFTTRQGMIKIGSQSDAAGSGAPAVTSSSDFDANANVSSTTDANGNKTVYSYDLARNLEISRTEAYGTAKARTITTSWHPAFRLPLSISVYSDGAASGPALTTTNYTYDGAGNLLGKTVVDPATGASRTWAYTYDSTGRLLTADGPRTDVSDVTTYTYYACTSGYQCGQKHTVTDALGHMTTYETYNTSGQPLTIIDSNGVITTLTYDLRQRLTSRSVGGETTDFEYWPTGLLKKVTLPDSSYLSYSYDAAHRLTQVEDGAGDRVVYTLDAMGNRVAESTFDPSNALARSHSQIYNTLNQLWKDVTASGAEVEMTLFGYDNNGNQTAVNAPLARNTTHIYDALNRLSQVTDPNLGVTQYGYDANDNLTSVTDPRNLTTSYFFNGLGDLTLQSSPDTGTTEHTYDAAGNLTTRNDARNKAAAYSYDALNRVTQIAYGDQIQTFVYDQGSYGIGKLASIADGAGTTAWTYNPQGRVSTKTQTTGNLSHRLIYSYNSAGQLSSLTTPSGQIIAYSYTNGQVSGITVNGSPVLSQVLYSPFAATLGWTWSNGMLTVRDYDTDGRLKIIDSAGLSTYSYGVDGAIEGIGHDSSVELGWVPGTATFAISSTSNRINGVTGSLARSYVYDSAGNTLSDGSRTFTYDDSGRMSGSNSFGLATQYLYNALGQRVRKSNGNETINFVYDESGRLLGEYGPTGNLIQEIVWLSEIPVASIRATDTGIGIFYIHTDHLNAPSKITRPNDNAVVWRWDHDPFGNGAPNEDPDGNGAVVVFNLRFPGQYYDPETGLNYNYYRDYDPTTGRYLESDPVGLTGGINTYSYGESDPISVSDPFGLRGSGMPEKYSGKYCGTGWNFTLVPEDYRGIVSFTSPCKRHDDCYRTCGKSKVDCDLQLRSEIISMCMSSSVPFRARADCMRRAERFFNAVDWFGGGAYDRAQAQCRCSR